MADMLHAIVWVLAFVLAGGLAGIVLVLGSALVLPKLIDRLTPAIVEEREIALGNRAVADYFGRVVAACILGISIVVAAAVLGGLIAAAC